MPSSSPPAVCFDLDGVLIDTMALHARAWLQAAAKMALSVSPEEIYAWEGEPGTRTAARLVRRPGPMGPRGVSHGPGKPGSRLSVTAAALLREKERRFTLMVRRHHVAVDRIWHELLDRLSRQRVPLALVTGTSSAEVRRVVPAAILRSFSVLVTGDRVRHGKPHPEPYRAACRALRRQPDTVLVLENAPYGIRSAQRASIGVVIGLATRLPPSSLAEADLIVRTPKAAAQLISHLAGSGPI